MTRLFRMHVYLYWQTSTYRASQVLLHQSLDTFSKSNLDTHTYTLFPSSSLHSSHDPLKKIEQSKLTRHLSSQGFETKPSDTFEQLQLLLQAKSKEPFDRPSHEHSRQSSSKSSSSLPRRPDNVPSSSSTASDKTRQDKSNRGYSDPEHLLRMAQRVRN